MWADFGRALGLLTTLPVRPRWDDATRPAAAMRFYPLVGGIIGALLAGLAWLLAARRVGATAALLPPALVLAAWAGLTGALHLDGWADCCDALFVPVPRARRLEIMKDPRLGSFGGVGLALLLLVKLAALGGVCAAFSAVDAARAAALLVVAPVCARGLLVGAAAAAPLARPDGMAFFFRRSLAAWDVVIAALSTLIALAAVIWIAGPAGLLPAGAAALAAAGVTSLATARLGGLTGDVYGALIEAAETAFLVAACFIL